MHHVLPEAFRQQISEEERKEFYDRLINFETIMSVVRTMLKRGIINVDEYFECEDLFGNKYGFPENSIYREKSLGRFSDIPSLYNTEPQHPLSE